MPSGYHGAKKTKEEVRQLKIETPAPFVEEKILLIMST
jgi:hypothetical protein